jgi:hypothetical protein
MNQVSDINLAIKITESGCVPSLSFYNYTSYSELEKDLEIFYKVFPNNELLISFPDREFLTLNFKLLFEKFKFSHAELIHEDFSAKHITTTHIKYFQELNQVLKQYRNTGLKVISKSLGPWLIEFIETYFPDTFDGYILKNDKGAGSILKRSSDYDPVSELVQLKLISKDTRIIISGGIESSQDIRTYLENGADAVCIGTLFAMSRESKISELSKKQIIESKKLNLSDRGKNTIDQNAIVFKEATNDNGNRTASLKKGIQDLTSGLVFVGTAISTVSDILSIEEIVKKLTTDI